MMNVMIFSLAVSLLLSAVDVVVVVVVFEKLTRLVPNYLKSLNLILKVMFI